MTTLKPCITPADDTFKSDEERYNWQMSVRANYLLLGDTNAQIPTQAFSVSNMKLDSNINWINKGEIIAGSFAGNLVHHADVKSRDIDIYFKSLRDSDDFLLANPQLSNTFHAGQVAKQMLCGSIMYNLIHGVHYDSPEHLISRFDIRACSIALDPNAMIVHYVVGAPSDVSIKRIVFNPIPHNTTVARLVKYAERGYQIDAYQRLFFAELIKSDMYNPDLELSTGYRAVSK